MLHLLAWFFRVAVGSLIRTSHFHHGLSGSTQLFAYEAVEKRVFASSPTVGVNVLINKNRGGTTLKDIVLLRETSQVYRTEDLLYNSSMHYLDKKGGSTIFYIIGYDCPLPATKVVG